MYMFALFIKLVDCALNTLKENATQNIKTLYKAQKYSAELYS